MSDMYIIRWIDRQKNLNTSVHEGAPTYITYKEAVEAANNTIKYGAYIEEDDGTRVIGIFKLVEVVIQDKENG